MKSPQEMKVDSVVNLSSIGNETKNISTGKTTTLSGVHGKLWMSIHTSIHNNNIIYNNRLLINNNSNRNSLGVAL